MSHQPLVDAVRNWVHFDNLCINLSKQITTARDLRNRFEEQVLGLLGKLKRLRIQGAYLEPVTKQVSIPLNWTGLEESLHKYFSEKNKHDETDDIIKYLKDNRNQKTTTFLKKILLENDSADKNLIT